MYSNRPFDRYVLIGDGDAYVFREVQTPSIFHQFFLPPNINKNKYKNVYIRAMNKEIDNCQQRYEHCSECNTITKNDPARTHADIDQTSILIQTSEDFVIQSENTVVFARVVFYVSIIISILKIIMMNMKS